MNTERILSVSEFNRIISDYLEQGLGQVVVQGEVSGFRIARDRLVYFDLKDAQARCLCFALKWELEFPLEDGMEVKITGMPKVFQGTGGLHLRVVSVELVGAGALQKVFEMLKKKLEGEGLFDARWKKPLPRFPSSLGIITSPTAAAYTDILKRLHERGSGLTIVLAPVAVQGATAPREIAGALQYFNGHHPVDVIILTRGGGSMEDLQAFNSEPLCRAVFASKIPIIAGVGHERDVTLVDFIADVRASTPTNAAELAVPHRREIIRMLDHMAERIISAMEKETYARATSLPQMVGRVWHAIEFRMQEVVNLFSRYMVALVHMTHTLASTQERVVQLHHRLEALSPQATLKRGYSITRQKEVILRDATQIKEGDILETELANGKINSRVGA